MARRVALALLLLGLLGTQVPTRGQDFDLSHALDDHDKKPTPAPPKQGTDDNFNLEDALGGGNNDPVSPAPPKPKPNPNPNQPGSSDGFSDLDLTDGTSDGGGGGGGKQRHDGEEQADSPGVVPGIVGAVAVAVAGAISSFIAYQKKKLCFKENDESKT
ncbi:CD99 antigen isoform X2 [Balaenoptera acutorostrata]|uniref:CD99 antigen isoform X2 n=1 Tax=Balaenoptera acutorostrata TaxID=9767 RepID=A0ABM3SV49_BALAC|nr:CD99 antigen isoform X2 [Balaenoptera acutorostrata]